MFVVPTVGEQELLRKLLNATSPDDMAIRLFVNDHTPTKDDTIDTYTELPSTDSSYNPISLIGDDWTVESNSGVTEAVHPQVTFTLEDAHTVYGYYVTDSSGDNLLLAERFEDGPYDIQPVDEIRINPKVEFAG